MLNTIIRLRRDNDYNYAKIQDRFIPANGEICLIDTAKDGLQAVCGDGKTPFGKLEYISTILVRGYFKEGNFYKDSECTEIIQPTGLKIYIDALTCNLYVYDGVSYMPVGGNVSRANSETPGIMKLYDTLGDNTDGTMTQKAITDELDDKVEIELNKDEELLIFTY